MLLACIVYYIPSFFSSLFVQMAENCRLQDTLLIELSDVNLFCKLIKYPAIRDNMLKTFKVRVSLCKSADLDSHKCFFTTLSLQKLSCTFGKPFFLFFLLPSVFLRHMQNIRENVKIIFQSICFPFLSPKKKNHKKISAIFSFWWPTINHSRRNFRESLCSVLSTCWESK